MRQKSFIAVWFFVGTFALLESRGFVFTQQTQPQQPTAPSLERRSSGAPVAGQTVPVARTDIATAIIRGRITEAIGGLAIPGAQVSLLAVRQPGSASSAMTRLVATDAAGRFEIKELPRGSYHVTASKTGFAALEYGQRSWNEAGIEIEVAAGELVEHIDVSLQRGGVIAVTVTDGRGDAMADVDVQALQSRFVNGSRQLLPSFSTTTDDLGQARLYGLSPGEYYLKASPPFATVGEASARTSYVPTYYPATFVPEEAQRVVVTGAQDTLVVVQLVASRRSALSGRALRSDGAPVAYTPLVFGAQDSVLGVVLRQYLPAGGFSQRELPTTADGKFSASDLVPGSYVLQVRPTGNSRAYQGDAEYAAVPITVAGQDVTDITIVSHRGASVSGAIRFDTGATPAGSTPKDFGLAGYYTTSDQPLSTGVVTMHDDWSWDIRGVAMTGVVRLTNQSSGWFTKSLVVDGKDITEAPMSFETGRDYKDAQLTLTQKRADVFGTAVDGAGATIKDYVALLFPQERDRWFPRSWSIVAVRPNQSGQFRIPQLAGGRYGSYYIVALPSLASGAEMDFELLARLAARAMKITLGESESKAVTLRLEEGR